MAKSEGFDLSQTVEELLRFGSEQLRSISRIRLIGYGLLVLALFDIIDIFIPPNFGNPVWEFQSIGLLVERVPVPLLGLVLIFFGENYERKSWEGIILKILTWLSLLIAVLFLLLVPAGIARTLQLDRQNNQQIALQERQQLNQLKQVEEQLQKGTNEDIATVAAELNRLGVPVNAQKPEELKTQLLDRIATAKEQLPAQAKSTRFNQRLVLFKNSAKWTLGALIASLLFLRIWQTTRWARRGSG